MVTEQQEQVIRVAGLTHGFGAFEVLTDLSFTIPRGAICGLLGPNGSGKTTLIQLLLGVLLPRGEGDIEVLGLDPRSEAVEIRRRVGYVPQVSDLDLGMTVGGTFDFLRPFFGARWNEEVFEGQLRRFGLDTMRNVLFDSLSVGLKQRVALVAALAIEPEVLLLDEPTAGLDAVVRRDFAEAVVDYTGTPGRSVVLSSHLLGELERLVDHVVILRPGQPTVSCALEELKGRLVSLVGYFEQFPSTRPELEGLMGYRQVRDQLRLAVWDEGEAVGEARRWLSERGAADIAIDDDSSLESLFIDLVGRGDEP